MGNSQIVPCHESQDDNKERKPRQNYSRFESAIVRRETQTVETKAEEKQPVKQPRFSSLSDPIRWSIWLQLEGLVQVFLTKVKLIKLPGHGKICTRHA